MKFLTSPGWALPYGVSKKPDGFNFSLFSKHATAVFLCLFEPEAAQASLEIPLDPKKNKTGSVWHIFIHKLPSHFHYGFRLEGPYEPLQGYVFDRRCVLIDPCAKLVAGPKKWGTLIENPHHISKAEVFPNEDFDWENDIFPNIPYNQLLIYEMHLRGFTADPSSNVKHPGTYLGMIEKIPYLKSLGVNAVELLPIHEFNEMENTKINPQTKERLYQYWGYSTVNFFSPMRRYATENGNAITEFKQLVKALHQAGMEIILDVVFNHTSEGNQEGPTNSFKGIENEVYYMLGPNGEYYNFTGCGNTFNCNHPTVRQHILECLRYWVTEMHVDGFRFDLASILARGHDGVVLEKPPIIDAITVDPILANTKLIAEAWDAAGLYQVGSFPGAGIWREWNGKYRDSIRKFIKGTDGEIGNFATRLSGSEDLYGKRKTPTLSINFITAHDGFSLYDLVSYNQKHNEINGEDNKDGLNDNDSWNCGSEGETTDPSILSIRQRQVRNFHVALMVSQGIPMILMGDEYCHTKSGNNNTWSHDSRINWFQWDSLEKNQEFFRFYRMMIAFRFSHPALHHPTFLKAKDVVWHGVTPGKPDWSSKARLCAFTLMDPTNGYDLYIAFNATADKFKLSLPPPPKQWQRVVDTSFSSPDDICEDEKSPLINADFYEINPFTSLILKSKR